MITEIQTPVNFTFITIFLQSLLDKKCKANYTKSKVSFAERKDAMITRIAELRRQQKLSQEDLAKAVGVTRQTITSLEVGKYTASLVLAHKIACFFNLTIEDIFLFEEEENL